MSIADPIQYVLKLLDTLKQREDCEDIQNIVREIEATVVGIGATDVCMSVSPITEVQYQLMQTKLRGTKAELNREQRAVARLKKRLALVQKQRNIIAKTLKIFLQEEELHVARNPVE